MFRYKIIFSKIFRSLHFIQNYRNQYICCRIERKMNSAHLIGPMKHFIKGSEEQKTSSVISDESKPTPRAAFVSGSHAKQFYEKIIGKEAFDVSNTNRLRKRERTCNKEKQSNSTKVLFNINLLMKAVETGNVKDAEKILYYNEDKVNNTDQFGWTPLMAACCAGDGAMVESLLKWRPELNVRDKKGNTCRHLAFAKGHTHIVDVLDRYSRGLKDSGRSGTEQSTSGVLDQPPIQYPFYCETCKQSVENTSLKKHLSSTVHNFNTASKRKMPTMYGIPESNKGFQILLKSGWDKETGLGPSGEGHKFPPKTILKQDRTGLGAKQYKPRVTHTLDSVRDARREAKPKDTFKRKLNSQKRKEQRLERNLREMLS